MFEWLERIIGFVAWVGAWVSPWVWFWFAMLLLGVMLRFIRVFGWKGTLAMLVGVLAVAGLGVARRGGWEDREKEGAENVKRVVEEARKARERSRVDNADPDRLRDDDGYRRD